MATPPPCVDDLNGNAAGALLVLWLALVHVIVWYPAEILDAAVGYVFGFGVGFPLVLSVLDPLRARLVLGRKTRRPASALPDRGGGAIPANRAGRPPRGRARSARRAADPDRALQPDGLRLRGGADPPVALHLDDGRRLRADHGLLHLCRQQARGLLRRGPDPLDRRRRVASGHRGRALSCSRTSARTDQLCAAELGEIAASLAADQQVHRRQPEDEARRGQAPGGPTGRKRRSHRARRSSRRGIGTWRGCR